MSPLDDRALDELLARSAPPAPVTDGVSQWSPPEWCATGP